MTTIKLKCGHQVNLDRLACPSCARATRKHLETLDSLLGECDKVISALIRPPEYQCAVALPDLVARIAKARAEAGAINQPKTPPAPDPHTQRGKPENQWTPENLRAVLRDRQRGMTFSAIGVKWRGISASAARDAVRRAERLVSRELL